MDVPSVRRNGARFKTDSVCCDAQKVLQRMERGFWHPVPTEKAPKSAPV